MEDVNFCIHSIKIIISFVFPSFVYLYGKQDTGCYKQYTVIYKRPVFVSPLLSTPMTILFMVVTL